METLNTHVRTRIGTNSLEDYCASNYTTRAKAHLLYPTELWELNLEGWD